MEKIGQGGSATVFKAVNRQTRGIIALKRVKNIKEELKQRVINEIGIMQLSVHPNVIRYNNCYEYSK